MDLSRTLCRIRDRGTLPVCPRGKKRSTNRFPLIGRRLSILLGLVSLIAAALVQNVCLATTTVTVSPPTWTLEDATTPVTVQANTAAPGNELTFDVYMDVDGDGTLDPEDARFMSFEIADGEPPHLGNEYYWHDEDHATNSSVTATLTLNGDWLFSGHFIVKVTDQNSSSAAASFTVVQDSSYPCVVTGQVQLGGSPAGGAIVQPMDMSAYNELGMATTGPDGSFELRLESPGEYVLSAMVLGSVSNFEEGSARVIEVSDGSNPLPAPLVVFDGNRSISGKVFDSNSAKGIPGMIVLGWTDEETLFSLDVTDDDGNYTLVVVDGEWEEISVEEGQISRFGYLFPEHRSVTVSGKDEENIGLLCERATTLITGTVKDAETMEGLQGYEIWAEVEGDGPETYTYSNADGSYKVGVIEADWWVYVDEDSLIGTGYAKPQKALVHAPASGTVVGVDFLLQREGTISGHVYQDDFVTPPGYAEVHIFEFTTWDWVAGVATEPDGSYSVSAPAGTYIVSVFNAEGWLDQYYLNTRDPEEASPVVVIAPEETSGIDFVLVRAAYITGHVYENDETTAIEGAYVYASVFGPEWEWAASGQTEADGSYTLTLPAGTYKVTAQDVSGWLNQFYDGVPLDDDATPVEAIGGQQTSGIDFVLQPAATINGHVYGQDGVTPIAGAHVTAYEEVSDRGWGCPPTDDEGYYSIPVPSGSYKVWAQADGWVGEYYDDTYRLEDATILTLAAPEERADINFALREATATINGHVFQEDGTTPLPMAWVSVQDYATDDYLGSALSGADGSYTLPAPAGTFRVLSWAHRWGLQYYNHQDWYEDATPVTLSGYQVREDIDFHLRWIPFLVKSVHMSTEWPGCLEVQWWALPGTQYSVFWTDELKDSQTVWYEVPDPYKDIVEDAGLMTWTDKGTSPGMNGSRPGDPDVVQRFYKVLEVPE